MSIDIGSSIVQCISISHQRKRSLTNEKIATHEESFLLQNGDRHCLNELTYFGEKSWCPQTEFLVSFGFPHKVSSSLTAGYKLRKWSISCSQFNPCIFPLLCNKKGVILVGSKQHNLIVWLFFYSPDKKCRWIRSGVIRRSK